MRRLAEDCCKYGSENQSTHAPLARASIYFGTSFNSIEMERENLLKILGDQVISSLSYSCKHCSNLTTWSLETRCTNWIYFSIFVGWKMFFWHFWRRAYISLVCVNVLHLRVWRFVVLRLGTLEKLSLNFLKGLSDEKTYFLWL